jgi:hypothetical protein
MIRSLHLADVPALLLFLSKSPSNEAWVRNRLGDRDRELAAALPLIKGCVLSGDKQRSFVCARRGLVQGLVCMRTCRGSSTWEVDRLLLVSGQEDCCAGLLERVGRGGSRQGVGRIFLRLSSDSGAVDAAREAGFIQYLTESLYVLESVPQVEVPVTSGVPRPKRKEDAYGIFRLYSATVPVQVRSVEGMTFQEWDQSRDSGDYTEVVVEAGGEVAAFLRVRFGAAGRQFDLMADQESNDTGALVEYGLAVLGGGGPVYSLVPEFQQQLRNALEERGFRQVGEYACFSRQLMPWVREPHLVPMQA